MKATLIATAKFYLSLTEAEITTLMTCSSIHYDGLCKSAGQQGGFLCGWHNWLVHGAPHENNLVSCSADFHQLDICYKILEMPRPTERAIALELSSNLHKLMSESNMLLAPLGWEIL